MALVWRLGLLAALVALARAQFPGDRLPIEEVSESDIYRACEVPIASESGDGFAPATLLGVGVSGTWAYEQTSQGVLKSASLPSSTGSIDLWISNDTSGSNLGLIHDVSAVMYVTGEPAKNDALEATVMVRARGHYVPRNGLLCLLGCQEALLPQMYGPKSTGNFTGVGGVGDGDLIDEPEAPEEDENVEAGVANPIPISQHLETQCRTRIVLRFSSDNQDGSEASVSGRLESLRQPGEAPFFSPIIITGTTGVISSQIGWFQAEMALESLVGAIQAACIVLQIIYMRKHQDSNYVSLTMVSVQIFVYAFYWIRSIYWPLRYLNSEILLYFLSDVANIPRFVEFAIFVLYVYLAVLVDTKRRKAAKPRSKPVGVQAEPAPEANAEGASLLGSAMGEAGISASGPGTSERQLAIFFWPVYVVVGAIMWWSSDFDTFLRESTFLFLVPQVLANYIWNLPVSGVNSVSIIYAIGNTAAQVVWLTYEVLRPRLMGYDAFFAFPHAWYWSSLLLMILQLAAFVNQRLSGGRWTGSKAGGSSQSSSATELTPTTLTGMVQP